MTAADGHAPTPCPACRGAFPGGRAGCQAAYDALLAAAHRDPARAAAHRLAVDAYCLQHPEPYCRSTKSYAAHLVGLCWGVEHGGHASGYAAVQRWLNGTRSLAKPTLPATYGEVTLADVAASHRASGPQPRVVRWAASVT